MVSQRGEDENLHAVTPMHLEKLPHAASENVIMTAFPKVSKQTVCLSSFRLA
jgi:hypothetical protein